LLNPAYQKCIPIRLRKLLFWGKREKYDYPPMDEETRSRLSEFYEPWNKELAEFLGREHPLWKE